MAAISQRIPNLLGGVSQQPDSLKLPGQVRTAINCIPDPTYGMLKRPGLKLVGALAGATAGGRWFSIIRDSSERYVGQFLPDGDFKIWDANTGAAKTVNSISTAAKSYIADCSQEDFETLQINDYNFVLNRSKTVQTLATVSASQPPTAIVVVNLIGYDVAYKVRLNSTEVTHTTPATGTLTVKDVVADLKTKVDGVSGFTSTVAGNTLIIKKTDSTDFTIDGEGGLSSQALFIYKDVVPNVSRLPSSCQNGLVLKVSNLEDAAGDDYFVKFSVTTGSTNVGSGVWEECLAPGIKPYIDPATMPHVIIREANGTFTFRPLSESLKSAEDLYWVERRVGDDETNPFPSFTGNKITGISFFRNRLVLLSAGNIICSQPGSYFNLFRMSALVQTDADAVDLSTGSLRPVDLKYAVGDQLGLVCFSENAQFMLTSDQDQFGPTSAQVKAFTTFTVNPAVRPVETGSSVVFVDNNQGFSQVTEMVVTSSDNRPSTADLSRTAPNFVPADLQSVVASSSASLISFALNQQKKSLKVFKFFNNAGERVLASWVDWRVPGNVLHQSVDHDLLLLVTEQQNSICLSSLSIQADVEGTAVNKSGVPFEYRLDLFKKSPTLTYDSTTNTTKVYFPAGAYDSTLTPVVVIDDSATQRGTTYESTTAIQDGSGWYIPVPGNRTTAENVVIGYSYELQLAMPVFYRKQAFSDGRAQSDVVNIPRVQRMVIQSTDSGPFDATVELLGRTTKTYTFQNRIANLYLANSAPLPEIVDNSIPIYGKGTDAKVTLSSKTPFPLSFVAATWYGVFSDRGIKSV
jgi:hypothetical protein